ncbi:MAG TPA: protein translocase subunit SecF [Candidatus Methanoperedens sp.]|nr:protein translocase subunit SecF [Candidatus Methanoperedens sp.]
MFQIIRHDTNYQFTRLMKPALIFSAALILLSLGTVIARGGLNYGIDFAGGTVIELKFTAPVDIGAVRDALGPAGLAGAEIKHFGGTSEVLVTTEQSSTNVEGIEKLVRTGLDARWAGQYEVQRLEMVGPKVGADLRTKALWSLIASWALMLAYVTWRFEFKFAIGGILALIHDVIISIGLFTLLGRTFSLTVLAAVLTIVGYSINDTIVIYDRIRELLRREGKRPFREIIDLAVNQTLSRSILTSLTVFFVLIVLFFFGGEIISDFSLILLIGVVIGSYSTIFIAAPVILFWEGKGIKLRT